MTNREMRTLLVESIPDLVINGEWRELAERAITLEVIDALAAAEDKSEKPQPRN